MSQTLADLTMKVDVSDLTKAQAELKKTGDATKGVVQEQDKLIADLAKATAAWLDYEKSTGKVNGALKDVATSFNPVKLAAAGMASAIAGLSLGALKSMVFGIVEARSSLYDMSLATGISVNALSGLKGIAMLTASSMEDVAALTTKFNQAVATSDRSTSLQAEAFKNLGVQLKDGNGHFKDTITLQQEASRKLADHTDGIEKDAYYMALWGKTAVNNKEYINELGKAEDIHGKLTEAQAKKAKDLEDQMKLLGKATGEFKNMLADAMVPWLLQTTTGFNDLLKAAGSLKNLFTNGDLFGDFGNDLKGKMKVAQDELDNHQKAWAAISWHSDGQVEDHKNAVKAMEGRIQTIQKLMDLETKRAAEARSDFAKNDPRALGTVTTTLANIKDKEVAGAGSSNAPKIQKSNFDQENKAEMDSIIGLAAAYSKLFGVEEQTFQQKLEMNIALGDFNIKKDAEGNIIKAAATKEELAVLRSNAAQQDRITLMIAAAKAEDAAWKETDKLTEANQNKLTVMRKSAAETEISRKVLATFGATQDDVNIAMSDFNIANAETALVIAKMTGATEQKIAALEDEVNVLKEIKGLQQDSKDANDAEIARQTSFKYGWSDAFNKYKQDATDSSKLAATVFGTASKGMEDAIMKFASTGKLSFSDFAASVLADLARIAAKRAVVGMFAMMGLADGGAFASPGVKAFAKGDVFNQPTQFQYSGGLGVLGEAGPESVMPLKRNASGQLGVIASGSSGGTVQNITIAVTVQGGNTNAETGSSVANKVAEQFTRGIVRQELIAAKRTGGILNPV